MNENQITEGLGEIMPLRLEALDLKTLDSATGMVIVDEVNGSVSYTHLRAHET